jgi:flagellar biogenesis protein FliO
MKRFLKRDAGRSGNPIIRVIANQYLGIKKNIALVEVPGSVLVIGISNDRINLLTKIEDPNVLDGIRENAPRKVVSFSDHLQRLTGRIKPAKNGD